jgi:hypothetical protein
VNASSVGLVPDAAKVSGSRGAQPDRLRCAIGATIPDLVVSPSLAPRGSARNPTGSDKEEWEEITVGLSSASIG